MTSFAQEKNFLLGFLLEAEISPLPKKKRHTLCSFHVSEEPSQVYIIHPASLQASVSNPTEKEMLQSHL